jgi:hypothetical protein
MTVPEGEEPSGSAGVLTKFMVIAIQVGYNDQGDAEDTTNIIYSDGRVLGYEAEGMLKMADRIYQKDSSGRTASWGDDDSG